MQGETGPQKKGAQICTQFLKIYEIKSPQILIRHLLPFSSIEGEVVDTGVE
jgi:hypothetical protein